MENRKITTITIIYQVEDYLTQCLESLMAQTYQNMEFILVVGLDKDPSKQDRCPAICEEYVKKDARFKIVFTQVNGVSAARNVGLEAVTGDLIGFVDGDDYVEPNMFAHLADLMDKNHAQIAVCGRFYEFQNKTLQDEAAEPVIYSPEEALSVVMSNQGFFLHVWDKLYERELLKDVIFPVGSAVEDRVIVNRILDKAERICYDSTPLYHFRERSGSMSKKPGMERDNTIANQIFYQYMTENHPALNKESTCFYLQELITAYQNHLVSKGSKKEDGKYYRSKIRQVSREHKAELSEQRKLLIKKDLALYFPYVLKQMTLRHQKNDHDENTRFA